MSGWSRAAGSGQAVMDWSEGRNQGNKSVGCLSCLVREIGNFGNRSTVGEQLRMYVTVTDR